MNLSISNQLIIRKEKNYTSLALYSHGLIQIFYATHTQSYFLQLISFINCYNFSALIHTDPKRNIPNSISVLVSYWVCHFGCLHQTHLASIIRICIIAPDKSGETSVRVDCVVKDPDFFSCPVLPSFGSPSSEGIAPHGYMMAFSDSWSMFSSDSRERKTDRDRIPS